MNWNVSDIDAALDRQAPRVLESQCPDCGWAVDGDAPICASCRRDGPDGGWPPVADDEERWLGRRLRGRYLVRRLLGRGATSNVYRVETPGAADRYAAKIIYLADPNFQEFADDLKPRIVDEIKILARIRSSHVVKFVDLVEISDHTLAVITTLVDGESLGEWIDRDGAFPIARALEIARQVAVGMDEVHRLGAVHRDLKPDNILVERLHDGDFAYVIDFGIVRLQSDVRENLGFIGTPLFASPEQAMDRELGPRSDIYSLGTVLYCMLTGKPPFESPSASEVLVQHVRDRRPRLFDTRPDVAWPEAIEALIAEMLAISPEDRPESMREVADRLTGLLWRSDAPTGLHQLEVTSVVLEPYEDPRAAESPDEPAGQEHRPGRAPLETPVPTPPSFLPEHVWTVAPDGRTAWAVDGEIRVRPTPTSGDASILWDLPVRPTALAFVEERLLIGLADGSLIAVHTTTGTREPLLSEAAMSPVTAVGGSPEGRIHLAAGGDGRIVCAVDGRDWEPLPTGPPVTAVAVDAVTGLVAVGTSDHRTRLVQPGHRHWTIESVLTHEAAPVSYQFSADGYLLACCIEDRQLEMYDSAGGRLLSDRFGCRATAATTFSKSVIACGPTPDAVHCSHRPTFGPDSDRRADPSPTT